MTVLTLAFCALTIAAGNWQRGRANEKEALQHRLDMWTREAPVPVPAKPVQGADFALRPVRAVGEYAPRYEILLDNRVYQGRAGYFVVTPLRLDDSDMHVLVLRGWTAGGRTRDELPHIPTPSGVQQVTGRGMIPSTRVLELAEVAPGRVWQNLLLERYQRWSGLRLQPFVIEQTNEAGDGLVRDWPRPDTGMEKHQIYAMQWYSFAAVALLLYVILNVQRIRE